MEFDIRLLGRFSIRRRGAEIPSAAYEGRLVRTLLRMLATRRSTLVPRDLLVDALWPDQRPADPDRNLNVILARARRALGDPSLILTGPGGYCLDPSGRCSVDAEEFSRLVRAGRESMAGGLSARARKEIAEAHALWRGEPLPEDASLGWAQEYRAALFRLHQEALELGAEAALEENNPPEAVMLAQQAVAGEPLREAAHLLMARALYGAGDGAAALAVLAAFKRQLSGELGLDPSAALDELELAILRGESPEAAPAGADGEFEGLPFIERARELSSIRGLLSSGSPGLVLVSGASGSGKSRLLDQVRIEHSGPLLQVAAFLGERDEPWSLGRALIREALALDARAVEKLTSRAAQALAAVAPELQELVLAGTDYADSESRRALAMEAAVTLLRAAPLVVDDLQWADPTSLALLAQLLHRTPPPAMVLAYRPEEVTPGSPAGRFLESLGELPAGRIRLDAFSREDIARLVADGEVAAALAENTDRSPLAVTEVIRALVGSGALERGSSGRWEVRTPDAAEQARAEGIAGQRKAFARRAQKLHGPAQRLMRLIALLGRPVPARLLATAAQSTELATLEHLEDLARSGLVHLTEGGWDTAHDLIGEAVSEELEPEEAARLHALLAAALPDPWEQAEHLAAAGDSRAAAEAYVDAGAQALDSFATEEGERSAEAGLALNPAPRIRSTLLEIRAEARMRRGLIAEARQDLRAAMPAKKSGPERSRILSKLAVLISGAEDYLQASELASLAVTEAGSDPPARARALAVLSMAEGNLNHLDEAERLGFEALELFRQEEDAHGMADMLELRALHTLNTGNLREGVEALGRVVELFEDSGKLLRISQPRCLRALTLAMEGRGAEALGEAEQARELSEALGHPEGLALAHAGRAVALVVLGRLDEATHDARAAVEIARRLGHNEMIAASSFALGLTMELSGRLEEAEHAYRASLEASRNLPLFLSLALARLGGVNVARGELEEAAHNIEESLNVGPPYALFESRLAHAELAAARHDPDAPAIAAEGLRLAEEAGHLVSVPRLRELASRPAPLDPPVPRVPPVRPESG